MSILRYTQLITQQMFIKKHHIARMILNIILTYRENNKRQTLHLEFKLKPTTNTDV